MIHLALNTVDGSEIWRKHQLRLVVYPIIFRVLAPSQVVVWDFWTINRIAQNATHGIYVGAKIWVGFRHQPTGGQS